MLKNDIIYLIGFMGSGKSTAGKKLASILGWSFVDLDKCIEEYSKMSIPEIFAKYGEDDFRKIESELLANFKADSKTVISTGGGTPCHSDNMDYMLSTGLTVYLKLTPGQLKSRLSDTAGKRPLLKNIKPSMLGSFIEEKLNDREMWYNRALITVPGYNLDINALVSLLKNIGGRSTM